MAETPATALTSTELPSPSISQPDWVRVERAIYHVRQTYTYTYSAPVWDVKQRLIMIPPDRHGDQLLLSHRTEVCGTHRGVVVSWEQDAQGNRVCDVRVEHVEHALEFEADYWVERTAPGVEGGLPSLTLPEHWGTSTGLLRHTALTAPDDRLRAAAAEIVAATSTPLECAERAHDWAASAISYKLGVTGVQTPAAMALHFGQGVCQDYAHILLCVLRLSGIPARYVSGHLLGEGAPHAWVEALVEDPSSMGGFQVIAYDPTHHQRVGLNYVTVAVGRDFADVTPTSGYFSGPASGRLSWSKQAEIVGLHYGDGTSNETIA